MPYAKSHPFKCARCGKEIPVGGWYFWSNLAKKAFHELAADGKTCAVYSLTGTPFPGKAPKVAKPATKPATVDLGAFDTPSKPDVAAKPTKPATPTTGDVIAGVTIDAEPLRGTGDAATIRKGTYREAMAAVTSLYVLQEVGLALTARGYTPNTVTADVPDTLYATLARFWTFKQDYELELARTMFDYLTVACVGEMRHGHTWLNFPFGVPASRSDAYAKSISYDPRSILPTCAKAFNVKGKWGGGYGGPKWANIASSAALYFKFRDYPVVFADHVVDLTHNGGVAFNKGYVFHLESGSSAYLQLLDRKRSKTLLGWSGQKLKVEAEVWSVCEPILKHLGPRWAYKSNAELDRQYADWNAECPVDHSRSLPEGPQRTAAREAFLRTEYRAWLEAGKARGMFPGEAGSCGLVKVGDGIEVLATIETVETTHVAPLAWGSEPFALTTKVKGLTYSSESTTKPAIETESYPEPRKDEAIAA
jgi:hypothetical protein